jgi:hypothetical protein
VRHWVLSLPITLRLPLTARPARPSANVKFQG